MSWNDAIEAREPGETIVIKFRGELTLIVGDRGTQLKRYNYPEQNWQVLEEHIDTALIAKSSTIIEWVIIEKPNGARFHCTPDGEITNEQQPTARQTQEISRAEPSKKAPFAMANLSRTASRSGERS